MEIRRVRTGSAYTYQPVMMDVTSPASRATSGQRVVVKRCHGCPPPNTMNHAHIYDMDGKFLGLVHTNSLKP